MGGISPSPEPFVGMDNFEPAAAAVANAPSHAFMSEAFLDSAGRGPEDVGRNPDDQIFVASLMKPVLEPGKVASWIAPPERGINNQPVDYEYVRWN